MAINKIKTGSINDSAVTTDKIQDSAVTNAKVSPAAAIEQSKVSGLATSISNLCSSISSVSSDIQQQADNIALLGFKMAVNDGLTVFNLIDGVVDEFNDESGTDEAEGSNDLYCGSSDYYINNTQPTGQSASYFAGFGMGSVTEPDTSPSVPSNPAEGTITTGTYTVPTDVTNIQIIAMGGGGGGSAYPGGHGGRVKGCLAVTPGQNIYITVAEGGQPPGYAGGSVGGGGGISPPGAYGTPGGGLTMVSSSTPGGGPQGLTTQGAHPSTVGNNAYFVAGGGGGTADGSTQGYGGGLVGGGNGSACGPAESPYGQTAASGISGGGGDQEQGGQGGQSPDYPNAQSGSFLQGGGSPCSGGAGGGGGYYGGGGGTRTGHGYGRAGGGSSYYGHPQVTNGDTVSLQATAPDFYQTEDTSAPCQAQTELQPLTTTAQGPGAGLRGIGSPNGPPQDGGDGYAFVIASLPAVTTSTTIVSDTFTSNSVATTARIVVFEENVETPTLNTDIIASISRDNGSTFTNATLSDSGYVTGSSGQRILTGQATISGQPSGQSMRWKLALANNTVKIHGVALQWS
jgi:hypothetical protein